MKNAHDSTEVETENLRTVLGTPYKKNYNFACFALLQIYENG